MGGTCGGDLVKSLNQYTALYFDLDGTLVDTMPLHHVAYAEVFANYGYELRLPVYLGLIGGPAREAIPKFCAAVGWGGIDDATVARVHTEKKLAFDRVLIERPPERLPASVLAERCRGRLPLALVSSGNRQGVNAILHAMGWQTWFDTIISGDDVRQGKPAPEAYLLAAQRLGLQGQDGLAFEDTEEGLCAARSAGMQAWDVRDAEVAARVKVLSLAPRAGTTT